MSCCNQNSGEAIHEKVKQYYGKELQSQQDCLTGVNCLRGGPPLPQHVNQAFNEVHDEVTTRYFGCGPAIPEAVEGCHVLDLGSGCGRDSFAMSKLVGPSGHVTGIDMTEEQLTFARNYIEYHAEKFGYAKTNVDFVQGYLEHLGDAGVREGSIDVIISNCVVNLCPDKAAVLREACTVLKEGGELYFSDMYTDTYLPDSIKQDPVLWGEGIGGALVWHDLYRLAAETGFSPPRLVTAKMVDTSKFSEVLGEAKFLSVTYRLFKLPKVRRPTSRIAYNGGIQGSLNELKFDHATVFKKDVEMVVDSDLASILSSSRFSKYFRCENAENAVIETAENKVDPVRYVQSSCTKQC